MTDKTSILDTGKLTNEQAFAISLRCLEYLAEVRSAEELVESVKDFRGGLEDEAVAFVDSDEINEAMADLISDVEGQSSLLDLIQSLFDQAGVDAKADGIFVGYMGLEGR